MPAFEPLREEGGPFGLASQFVHGVVGSLCVSSRGPHAEEDLAGRYVPSNPARREDGWVFRSFGEGSGRIL